MTAWQPIVNAADASIKNLAVFWKQNLEFGVISIMIGKASDQLYEITRCGNNSEYIPNICLRHFVGETPKKLKKWCILVHFGA